MAFDTLLDDGGLHAVIDGAFFDDLPRLFRERGLPVRSLYLTSFPEEPVPEGPWLVRLADQEDLDSFLAIASLCPGGVFWHWPGGSGSAGVDGKLWNHLRRLNKVDIPEGADLAGPRLRVPRKWDRVLFRHADPRVLRTSTRVLRKGQLVRLLGDADRIVLWFGDGRAPYTLSRASLNEEPEPGTLQFDREQYRRLTELFAEALIEEAVHEFSGKLGSDAAVRQACDRAAGYGLVERTTLWQFLDLEHRHGPRFEFRDGCEEVLEDLTAAEYSPASRIAYAAQSVAKLSRKGA